MDGNVIVGQSGGPTSVINSSLAGVYKTAIDRGAKKVYGMLHGIKGLLDGQYVDLSEKINSTMDIDLLKRTPSQSSLFARAAAAVSHPALRPIISTIVTVG
jgi:ATP-dependent phosphofructokinase / diphosphate-dependent phosphofructokinase